MNFLKKEPQPNTANTQNLESDKSAALLTESELNEYKKLPKEEQKKKQEARLKKLEELQNEFRKAVEEANKTGKVEEAQKLKTAFAEKAEELKQLIAETERLEKFGKVLEIIPDKDIISAETAIEKLKKEGYLISYEVKSMLTRVNWKEKLKDSYEIISISVGELFGDKKLYTYAEIKAKAIENGLELVPAKLAPSIRLNYEKSGSETQIATKNISSSGYNYRYIFSCTINRSGSWLENSAAGDDGRGWSGDKRFFFVRKQKPQSKTSWIHKFLKL